MVHCYEPHFGLCCGSDIQKLQNLEIKVEMNDSLGMQAFWLTAEQQGLPLLESFNSQY